MDPSGGSQELSALERGSYHSGQQSWTPGPVLPTRVSQACQRCRRHKSRCDVHRPCTSCVRSNSSCIESQETARPSKRQRLSSEPPAGPTDKTTGGEISIGVATPAPTSHAQETPRTEPLCPSATSPEGAQTAPTPAALSYPHTPPSSDYQGAQSTMGITRKIFELRGHNSVGRATSAIPDGEDIGVAAATEAQNSSKRHVSEILRCQLPSRQVMDMLLDEYFDSVHWFSLVIYEPRFRPEYNTVADGYAYLYQEKFLILLTAVLGIAAWYRSKKMTQVPEHHAKDWHSWSADLLALAGAHFFQLMDETSLASIQTCLLLGTYHVYHGRPNTSFALLGATTKIAQAMGLHREPARGTVDEIEERKRVWWTIYTWDRFASITYGRPLGINDHDCNVSMPVDTYEWARPESPHRCYEKSRICFSTYQRELNRLYMIASPMIEIIFGLRKCADEKRDSESSYTTLLHDIQYRLSSWRAELPDKLVFPFDRDIESDASPQCKAYRLQALSLQLTYDNILIILHRPTIFQQVDSLCKDASRAGEETSRVRFAQPIPSPPNNTQPNDASNPSVPNSQEWWRAAVRIAQVTTLPNVTQLATDSHLVAFLAIIVFNSAVVMAVCALSEPLSNHAQEAKRHISRIFRLEELLGNYSTLPRQSSALLRDIIQLLLDRESETILAPAHQLNTQSCWSVSPVQQQWEAPISVEEVVRGSLPFPGHLNAGHDLLGDPGFHVSGSYRLNESLASVQRVFPTSGFDSVQNTREGQLEENRSRQVYHQEGLSPATNGYPANLGASGNFPAGDAGLYWIWDI